MNIALRPFLHKANGKVFKFDRGALTNDEEKSNGDGEALKSDQIALKGEGKAFKGGGGGASKGDEMGH